jgi:hypothetical protein
MTLARFVLTANKDYIAATIEEFRSKEGDQIRLLIDVDIMNLIDMHCMSVQIS